MRIDKTIRRKGIHTGSLTKNVGNVVKPIRMPKLTMPKLTVPKIQKLKLPKLPQW